MSSALLCRIEDLLLTQRRSPLFDWDVCTSSLLVNTIGRRHQSRRMVSVQSVYCPATTRVVVLLPEEDDDGTLLRNHHIKEDGTKLLEIDITFLSDTSLDFTTFVVNSEFLVTLLSTPLAKSKGSNLCRKSSLFSWIHTSLETDNDDMSIALTCPSH